MIVPVLAVPYVGLGLAYKSHRAKAVISIVGPEDGYLARIPFHVPVLRLDFSDIHCGSLWSPKDVKAAQDKGLSLVDADDIKEAIRFGRLHASAPIVVHCAAGISRSPAIALAILADRTGKGREAEAVAALRAHTRNIHPNPYIVGLADSILGREGALMAALLASEPLEGSVTTHDIW